MTEKLIDDICNDLRSRLLACSAEFAHYELFVEKDGSWLFFTVASPLSAEFERKLP